MAFMKPRVPSISDNQVTTAKFADDAVTLAKMASGTDGNIITYDTSGNPAVAATGSSGQRLQSGGAGVAPTMATVSLTATWVLLETVTASGAGTATFSASTMFDGTYDRICIHADGWHTDVDERDLYLTVSDDGGSSYESANYDWHVVRCQNTASYGATAGSSTSAIQINDSQGNAANESAYYQIWMSQPDHTAHHKLFWWTGCGVSSSNEHKSMEGVGAWLGGVGAINRVRFSQQGGNITCVFRAWGLKDS